jgi:hypothetical protein
MHENCFFTTVKGKRIVLILSLFVLLYVNFFVYKLSFTALAVVLIVGALIFKKEDLFLKELSIPMLLLFLYEILRAEAYNISKLLNRPLLNDSIIQWEKSVFSIDSQALVEFLQKNFSAVGSGAFTLNWYDYLLFLAYVSFFWFWIFIAFLAWKKGIRTFRKYIYGFLGISLFSTVIYIFFPSAPPWYAGDMHLLPDVERIFFESKYFGIDYQYWVNGYGHNDFAAFPSLHAAWSFYGALWGEYIIGAKGLLLFLVPILVIFSTWYGGEHYVIDSVFGCALASFVFLLGTREDWLPHVKSKLKYLGKRKG